MSAELLENYRVLEKVNAYLIGRCEKLEGELEILLNPFKSIQMKDQKGAKIISMRGEYLQVYNDDPPPKIEASDHMTVNHGVAGSRPARGANSDYMAKVELPIDAAVSLYLAYMQDHQVPEHLKKNNSHIYAKEVARGVDFLLHILPHDTSVHKIGPDQVGTFYKALISKQTKAGEQIGSNTFNMYVGRARAFFKWLQKRGFIKENPFLDIPRRKNRKEPTMISVDEFNEVLNLIETAPRKKIYKWLDHELGCEVSEVKTMWRPWLIQALKLALYGGGRRREELAIIMWSDVFPNPDTGQLLGGQLRYRDLKGERGAGIVMKDERKFVFVPIIRQLAELLTEMGYEDNKGKNIYLIASNLERRMKINEDLSKCFAHYYQFVKAPREEISFKSIRKLYITTLRAKLRSGYSIESHQLTGHAGAGVIDRHYEDPIMIRKEISETMYF
jgi:integrase